MIKSILELLNLGIKEEDDSTTAFFIKILNVFALSTVLVSLTSIVFVRSWISPSIVIIALYVTIGILAFWFNRKRQFYLSKILLILVFPTLQCLNTLYIQTWNSGAELTILPFVLVAPFMFADQKRSLLCTTYLALLLGVCLSAIGYFQNEGIVYNTLAVFLGLVVCVFLFIRHLRSTAQELEKKNKSLQEKNKDLKTLLDQNKLKSELLAILSHDLKGPVLSFNMLSEKVAFLLRNEDHDTLLAMADSFEGSSQKLFKNMDNLLNWSISQRDTIQTYFQFLPLKELVEDALISFEHILINRDIEVDLKVDDEIGLVSDEHILTIIIKNVIDNAIKYSPDRSRIVIGYNQDDHNDYLYVLDHGCGIKDHVVDQLNSGIFKKSMNGFGLGLKISMDLLKIIKGSICFEKGDIIGTKVTLSLRKGNVIEIASEAEKNVLELHESFDN